MSDKKPIGTVIHIDQDNPIDLAHYIDKWVATYTETWEKFYAEAIYDYYKRLGYDRVLVLCEEELKKLLDRCIKQEPTLKECIDLLKQEGSDTKQQVLEKLEELVK